jgi:hypothetical protein
MDTQHLKSLQDQLLAQTHQSKKIVAFLYDIADWCTRDELAKGLKKNRLTPHDIALLERLAAEGLIETKKRDRPGRIGFEFIHRLKPDIHRGIHEFRQHLKAKRA